MQVELHMFFCTIFRFAGGNLDFVAGEKNVCFCGSSLAPHLSVRGQPWKNLGNKVGPRGKKVLCLAGHCWQCSRMQPVDSPCEVRPSKRTCIEKERQPIYYYTVVYVGVYIYILLCVCT